MTDRFTNWLMVQPAGPMLALVMVCAIAIGLVGSTAAMWWTVWRKLP